ncbi:MAG TPA: hypothetical protein VKB19_02990 [Pedobacter sp.]|nr:hypothetical protein [Pedobacter sp.]
MKYITPFLFAGILLLTSCGTGKERKDSTRIGADTVATSAEVLDNKGQLTARMVMSPVIRSQDSLRLHFMVYNPSTSSQRFCKWHTPFEPPMSKYLDIKDEQGTEAEYHGIMAKRVMPPPPDSFLELKSRDSLSVTVDISKIYILGKSGRYTVRYNAEGISGLSVKDSISFVYEK